MGLLANSERGVWSLTEAGKTVRRDDLMPLHRKFVAESRSRRQGSGRTDPEPPAPERASDWRSDLLDELMGMAPDAFERLAQRLLREAGFISATVTGRTNPQWPRPNPRHCATDGCTQRPDSSAAAAHSASRSTATGPGQPCSPPPSNACTHCQHRRPEPSTRHFDRPRTPREPNPGDKPRLNPADAPRRSFLRTKINLATDLNNRG